MNTNQFRIGWNFQSPGSRVLPRFNARFVVIVLRPAIDN